MGSEALAHSGVGHPPEPPADLPGAPGAFCARAPSWEDPPLLMAPESSYAANPPGMAWVPGSPSSIDPPAGVDSFGSGNTVHDAPPELQKQGSTERRHSGVFQFKDSEAIKARVRATTTHARARYKVEDFYHDEGIFQAIAKDPKFEKLTLLVIIFNAIWIAVDTDYNTHDSILDADFGFVLADILFFAYFSVELFIRFMAFARKLDCGKDGWFVFDSCLVIMYAVDPFILAAIQAATGGEGVNANFLRLLRLARLSRLVRMLKALPELMIMIKGMFTAAASVSYTLGLLVVITYVFAIAMTQVAKDGTDIGDKRCPELSYTAEGADVGNGFEHPCLHHVGESMYTLFVYGMFLDDLADFADAIKEQSTLLLVIATIFAILASMTIMNMLIGVLCEVISAVAEEERLTLLTEMVQNKFEKVVATLDADSDGNISHEEFSKIMEMPEALQAFQSIKVEPECVVDLAEDWFRNKDGEPIKLELQAFMEKVVDLRGGQNVTMKEIMSVRKHMNLKFGDMGEITDEIEVKVSMLCQKLNDRRKSR